MRTVAEHRRPYEVDATRDRYLQYRDLRGLSDDDYSFSEQDLVRFFRGERREMGRYIVDAQRDAVMHASANKLLEFVEWAGKGADRPLSYNAVERSFFKEFLYKKALDSPIDQEFEQGLGRETGHQKVCSYDQV